MVVNATATAAATNGNASILYLGTITPPRNDPIRVSATSDPIRADRLEYRLSSATMDDGLIKIELLVNRLPAQFTR